jgi:hypothetical protein
VALLYFFNPNFWFRTPDATPTAGESRLALRFFVKKFAPAVSVYSLQGHFCALKPQKHKWKYMTIKNTKVESTPQKQAENNINVGLVHLFAGFSCVCVPKTRRAHLRIPTECRTLKTYTTHGFAGFSRYAKWGRL